MRKDIRFLTKQSEIQLELSPRQLHISSLVRIMPKRSVYTEGLKLETAQRETAYNR